MTACDLDGTERVVIDRDRFGATWRCPFCGAVSREDFEPDPANDLQRSFDQ